MKKLLISILLIFSISSCGLFRKTPKEVEHTYFFMQTLIENTFTYSQLDSICVADRITFPPEGWSKMLFIDGETGKAFEQYLYLVEKGDTTYIYNVIPNDDNVFVQKRIQIEN